MADRLRWNGKQVEARIAAEMRRRLSACSIAVANYAKQLINTEGTIRRAKTTYHVIKDYDIVVKRKGTLKYGANPSAPGDPPHKQHGRLLGSIAWELVGMVARVGTNVKYGRWLELGTARMAARPWLRVALRQTQSFIKAVLCRPMDLR